MEDTQEVPPIRQSPNVGCQQQYLKLQKDIDEESWISGEELRTEGEASSDDEKSKLGRRMKKAKALTKRRNNKDCSGDNADFTLAVPAFALPSSQSSQDFQDDQELPKMPNTLKSAPDRSVRMMGRSSKSKSLNSIKIVEDRLMASLRSPRNDDESVSSSQSLAESLSLEHQWRPKRGSLKLPSLSDGLNAVFYEKIVSILEPPESDEAPTIQLPRIEEVDNLTKKIIQDIQTDINDLEESINEQMRLLEVERGEKFKIEEAISELCNEGHNDENGNSNLIDWKDGNLEKNVNDGAKGNDEEKSGKENRKHVKFESGKNFIKRNIELSAKMDLPFTDEEKKKLELLLRDIEPKDGLRRAGSRAGSSPTEFKELEWKSVNAYQFSDEDKFRLKEIDEELEKYAAMSAAELATTEKKFKNSRDVNDDTRDNDCID